MTKERILKDYWRQEFDENQDDMIDMNVDLVQEISSNTDEDCEELENFGEEMMELILDTVLNKLNDDIHDESYKERMCEWLGMTYKTPPPILIEKVEVTRYTIGPGESYTKGRILKIDELPRTSANVATIRAELMKEMDTVESFQGEA
ncbi:hypothetical protein Tco_1411704 [Tanacetum coccineum]